MKNYNILTWYANRLQLPKFGSPRLNSFIRSSAGLLRNILKSEGLEISVIISKYAKTAYADSENKLIAISNSFTSIHAEKRLNPEADEALTCGAILGIICHEAAHFWQESPNRDIVGEWVLKNTTAIKHKNFAYDLYNILEDILIEWRFSEVFQNLSWMLSECNEYMFGDRLDSAVEYVENMTGQPKDFEEVAHCTNYLLYLKANSEYIPTGTIANVLFGFVHDYMLCVNTDCRRKNTLQVYNWLLENLEAKESQAQNQSFEDFLEELEKMLPESVKEEMGEYAEDSIQSEAKHEEKLDKKAPVVLCNNGTVDNLPFSVKKIEVKNAKGNVQIDSRFSGLARVAAKNANVNRPFGKSQDFGKKVRKSRLHRIATDSKVFSKRIKLQKTKPSEVIVLVDCSLSMNSGTLENIRERKIQTALNSALGAYKALKQGKCIVSVYGHTTGKDNWEDSEVVMYEFASKNDNLKAFQERAEMFLGVEMSRLCANNADSYAIKFCGDQFQTDRKKILIVISDGQPASHVYKGDDNALELTQEEVNNLRKKGIEVVSLSIEQDAEEANDFIYGENFNTKANSADGLIEIIQRIV